MKAPLSPEQVLKDHLGFCRSGDEEDFLRSYREDSFLVMADGVQRGLEGIRVCYRRLNEELPNARYVYKSIVVEENVGFLEWSADSDPHTVAQMAQIRMLSGITVIRDSPVAEALA